MLCFQDTNTSLEIPSKDERTPPAERGPAYKPFSGAGDSNDTVSTAALAAPPGADRTQPPFLQENTVHRTSPFYVLFGIFLAVLLVFATGGASAATPAKTPTTTTATSADVEFDLGTLYIRVRVHKKRQSLPPLCDMMRKSFGTNYAGPLCKGEADAKKVAKDEARRR